MAKVGYRIVDADSHVFEPAEVWDRYVESEYRALARTAFYFRTDEEGLSTAILNGRAARLPGSSRLNRWAIWRPGMTADEIGALDPSIYHPINPAASDAAAKLRDMDAMGIEKAIIFPTLFAEYFPVVDNPELARVLSRAYNDWLYDWCGEDRNRLYPIAVLPMQDVSYALAELRRAASRGFKGCFIRPAFIHESDFPTHLKYRPLWEELERNGLVACLHPSAGHTNPEWTSLGAFVERVAANLEIGHNVAEAVACDGDNAIALTALLFCGHLEDYPRLKVAFIHGGAPLLYLALEKCETYLTHYSFDGITLKSEEVFSSSAAAVTFYSWEASTVARNSVLRAKCCWGSRHPHHDAATPEEGADALRAAGADESTIAQLMGINAMRLYGIEQ